MRALVISLLTLIPLGAQQRYYVAGARPGLVVSLSEAPGTPVVREVRLPVPIPPTAQAQAMAQAELEQLCLSAWEVALVHDPDQSGGISDVWLLRRPDGWKPRTRLTAGSYLISFGLVTAPLGMGEPLQDVFEQAFVNAAAHNQGWFARITASGQNAWIVGSARMLQYFELQQQLTNSRQTQQQRQAEPAEEKRITIEEPWERLSDAQKIERNVAAARAKGYNFDPQTLRLTPIAK